MLPYSIELILSVLTNEKKRDVLNHRNKIMFPLGLIYFDLKNEVSIIVLISIKILIKLQKTQKTVDTLSRHKTDFA